MLYSTGGICGQARSCLSRSDGSAFVSARMRSHAISYSLGGQESVEVRMLKRIKARNFLSLRDIDLELGPRNVFVGPNMSGKSNLIESLKFLQESVGRAPDDATSLQQAFSKRGSFDEVVWKGNRDGPIALEIVADLTDPSSHQSKSCD